jgi:GNAT superfamily N-acetyltransferase
VLEVSASASDHDEQVSLDIYNAVVSHDVVSMDEVRSFRDASLAYVDYLAREDGQPVGSAAGAILPQRPDRVYALITVLGGHRGRGAGSALYAAVSSWAAEHGIAELEAPLSDNDPESLAFARRRGFTEVMRELGVVLDLAGLAPPEVRLPDGIEIVTWAQRPELARGMYEVMLEAHPDIPGAEDDELEPFEDWLAHDMQGAGDRPEGTFIALAGQEVVGYAKFHLVADSTIAYHDLSAVKRAWRGRGIARALKATQINWALANGYTELRTRNEERNEPIRRLNASFGYRPGIGRIFLVGPLAGS